MLTVMGKTYDIDSPYDVDPKKKSTSSKKKVTKKRLNHVPKKQVQVLKNQLKRNNCAGLR